MESTLPFTPRHKLHQLNSCLRRDAILNLQFEANWAFIKQRKQKMIIQNNVQENLARRDHTYFIGDKVMVKQNPNRKHGEDQFTGPFTVVRVYNNGNLVTC